MRGIEVFLDFLKAEQARGVTHVSLDTSARMVLRALHERLRNPAPRRTSTMVPLSSTAPSVVPSAPVRVESGVGSKAERIARLREQADRWLPARQLGTLREVLVFSTGNPDAEVVFVGEAPGYEEERKGVPFVGAAGKKLDDIFKAMGLSRAGVYLTQIVKTRPAMARQATNNRKPTAEEIRVWLPFVKAELDVIRPKCIVALGETAADGLLGIQQDVGALRGKWHDFEGVPVRVSYHPGYLLRSDGRLEPKRELWEDMLAVMEHLGMPISEKQRGFFLPKC